LALNGNLVSTASDDQVFMAIEGGAIGLEQLGKIPRTEGGVTMGYGLIQNIDIRV